MPAQLFRASGVTADAVTPDVRKSSSDCSERTLGDGCVCEGRGPLGWEDGCIHIDFFDTAFRLDFLFGDDGDGYELFVLTF